MQHPVTSGPGFTALCMRIDPTWDLRVPFDVRTYCMPQRRPDRSTEDPASGWQAHESDEDTSQGVRLLHDLATPLTVISGYTQLLRRRATGMTSQDAAVMERSLKAIEGAVDRMLAVLKQHVEEDAGQERRDKVERSIRDE